MCVCVQITIGETKIKILVFTFLETHFNYFGQYSENKVRRKQHSTNQKILMFFVSKEKKQKKKFHLSSNLRYSIIIIIVITINISTKKNSKTYRLLNQILLSYYLFRT